MRYSFAMQLLNMIYIIAILFVMLASFGLVRQSITYPNEEWSWMLVRNIFYKPYFVLYAEVYADEIAPCGDRGELREEFARYVHSIWCEMPLATERAVHCSIKCSLGT